MVMHTLAGFLEVSFQLETTKADSIAEQLALAKELRRRKREEEAKSVEAFALFASRKKIIEDFKIEEVPPCFNTYGLAETARNFYLEQGYTQRENDGDEFILLVKDRSKLGLSIFYSSGAIWGRVMDLSQQ